MYRVIVLRCNQNHSTTHHCFSVKEAIFYADQQMKTGDVEEVTVTTNSGYVIFHQEK